MKLIIGLGNPGTKYRNTRHNTGFIILDKLRDYFTSKGFAFTDFSLAKDKNAKISSGTINSEKVILTKPQTYMNNSGSAVAKLTSFYKLDPQKDIVIIYDDIDLDLGKIKTKGQSSAGHKGMQSIIDYLKTDNLKRIRVGISNKEKDKIKDTSNYVLAKFNKEEREKIDETTQKIFSIIYKDFLKP